MLATNKLAWLIGWVILALSFFMSLLKDVYSPQAFHSHNITSLIQ